LVVWEIREQQGQVPVSLENIEKEERLTSLLFCE
jgi:hypothetical protein